MRNIKAFLQFCKISPIFVQNNIGLREKNKAYKRQKIAQLNVKLVWQSFNFSMAVIQKLFNLKIFCNNVAAIFD